MNPFYQMKHVGPNVTFLGIGLLWREEKFPA